LSTLVDIRTFVVIRLIGGILHFAWLMLKMTWWLIVLAVTSTALMVRSRQPAARILDAGAFVRDEDALHWRDQVTGARYLVDETTVSRCIVQASATGLDMRMTAVSRLAGNPPVLTYKFSAVTDGSGQVVASAIFPQQRYRGVSLDHADPLQAADDPCDLRFNREQALSALGRLDRILFAHGWSPDVADDGVHWYSRRYRRPAIRWDSPITRM